MDFGYHNASFEYRGDATEKSLAASLTDRARLVEDAGFTWFTLMDHFWQLEGVGRKEEDFIECYSGLSAVAEATDEMDLSGLVTCIHYRNPAYLAKTMASLDTLSEGRGVLGIGAGWYEAEYEAIGAEFRAADRRIRELRDVIKLCRTAWSEDSPVDYDGRYYDLDGLYLEPKPDDIPVLVGGGGEQLTLRLTAEYADSWNIPGADPDEYQHKLDVLRDHCEDVGREYEEIEKTVTHSAMIREETEAAHDAFEEYERDTDAGPAPREDFRGLVGTPAEVADLVAEYEDLGVDTLQIQPLKNDRETTERFVDEVAPQF
jgi:F420-dependent oxidoreductase-like protein